MSASMRVTCGELQFTVDLPSKIVEGMASHGDPFEMAGARGWPEDDESDWDCIASAEKLTMAFSEVLAKIKTDAEPHFVYIARARIRDTDLEDEGSGMICGFRINGEIHDLILGVDECTLEHILVQPDGKGKIESRKDVRHLSTIDTDDIGQIRIRKRKVAGDVEKWIKKVLKKLERMKGDVVVEVA